MLAAAGRAGADPRPRARRRHRAEALDAARALAADLARAATCPILGLGVGTPGTVDRSGTVLWAPNLHWTDLPLQQLLADDLGLPVRVENDANVAVLAERRFAGGPGDLVRIQFSRGVGAGLLVGGHLVHGAASDAGEIGHVTIGGEDGPLCGCGKTGCLEAWASVPVLRGQLEADPAGRRDPGLGRTLGLALAPVVGMLGLQHIVVGGPADVITPAPLTPPATASSNAPAGVPARLELTASSPARTPSCSVPARSSNSTNSGSPDLAQLPITRTIRKECNEQEAVGARSDDRLGPGPRRLRRGPVQQPVRHGIRGRSAEHHPVAGRWGHPGCAAGLPEDHLQGQERRHPHDRGAGLGRSGHQADHGPAGREQHPDVVEVGNTLSPTFTNVGAFSDVSDLHAELGGDKLLQSFVEVGKVDGKNYTLPYYFGCATCSTARTSTPPPTSACRRPWTSSTKR